MGWRGEGGIEFMLVKFCIDCTRFGQDQDRSRSFLSQKGDLHPIFGLFPYFLSCQCERFHIFQILIALVARIKKNYILEMGIFLVLAMIQARVRSGCP